MQRAMANLVVEWVDSGMMDTEPDKGRAKAFGWGRRCTAETIKVRRSVCFFFYFLAVADMTGLRRKGNGSLCLRGMGLGRSAHEATITKRA